MDTSKLYEVCDIIRKSFAITNGEETYTESTVYSAIDCYVKPQKAQTNAWNNEQSNTQTVIITIDKWYTVLIGDNIQVGSIKYIVEEVKAFWLIQNSNIRLKCTRI